MTHQSSEAEVLPLKDLSASEIAVLAKLDLSGNAIAHELQQQANNIVPVESVAQPLYDAHPWLNEIRLVTMRSLRVLTAINSKAPILSLTSIPMLLASLIYGVRLLVDTAEVAADVFFPRGDDIALTYLQRLKKTFTDDRAKRMRNDIFWMGVNLADVIYTLFAYASFGALLIPKILLVIGYAFDTGHEAYDWKRVFDLKKLQNKVEKQVKAVDAKFRPAKDKLEGLKLKMSVLSSHYFQYQKPCYLKALQEVQQEYQAAKAELSPLIEKHEKEKAALIHIQNKLAEEKRARQKTIIYTVAMMALIAVGSGMFLFCPPAGIAMIVGACVALAAGSVFSGLGKKLYQSGKNIWKKLRTKNPPKEISTPSMTQQTLAPTVAPVQKKLNQSTNIVNRATTPSPTHITIEPSTASPSPVDSVESKSESSSRRSSISSQGRETPPFIVQNTGSFSENIPLLRMTPVDKQTASSVIHSFKHEGHSSALFAHNAVAHSPTQTSPLMQDHVATLG